MKNNIELLEEAQELLDLNQRELGIYIGVSARCVNAWMTGERAVPSYVTEMANRLAHIDAVAMAEGRPTSTMARWAVIRSSGLDEFIDVYGNKADALRAAEVEWKHLTASEKKKAETFMVGMVNVQICDEPMADSRFQQAVLENGSIDADIYDVAKDFLQN